MWSIHDTMLVYMNNDEEYELCTSLVTGHMTWAFGLMIRNT
jgi:hypothetical protein